MNDLSNAERETCLNLMADDRSSWIVFSDDPVMMRKLDEIGQFERAIGAGKEYRLRTDQVVLRSGKKRLSESHRAQLSERMRQLRKSQVTT